LGQLILRKIIKIITNRFQILRQKCTNIDFGCGANSAPLDLSAGIKGTYFYAKERGAGRGRAKEREHNAGEDKGEKGGKVGKGTLMCIRKFSLE